MLVLHRRDEVEALTYHEVVEILLEDEEQENDRRRWTLALTSKNPVESYNEMRESIETRLDAAEGPEIDDMPAEEQSWFRNTTQAN